MLYVDIIVIVLNIFDLSIVILFYSCTYYVVGIYLKAIYSTPQFEKKIIIAIVDT